MRVEFREWVTREDVQKERNNIFVFGDNLLRTGLGGQAKEMRGEPNSFGIPTKRKPTMGSDAFFSDSKFEMSIVINHLLQVTNFCIPYNGARAIVWPLAGIGSGMAKLELHSPHIHGIIRQYEAWLHTLTEQVG